MRSVDPNSALKMYSQSGDWDKCIELARQQVHTHTLTHIHTHTHKALTASVLVYLHIIIHISLFTNGMHEPLSRSGMVVHTVDVGISNHLLVFYTTQARWFVPADLFLGG